MTAAKTILMVYSAVYIWNDIIGKAFFVCVYEFKFYNYEPTKYQHFVNTNF